MTPPLEGHSQGSKRAMPLGLSQEPSCVQHPPTNKCGGGSEASRGPAWRRPILLCPRRDWAPNLQSFWRLPSPLEPACGCLMPHKALPFSSAQRSLWQQSGIWICAALGISQPLHCPDKATGLELRAPAPNPNPCCQLLGSFYPALKGSGELPVVTSRGRSWAEAVSVEAEGAVPPIPPTKPPWDLSAETLGKPRAT